MRHLAARYYAPSLLATTGSMMLVPTLPLYLRDQTESLTLVSLILASAAIGGLVANIPSGMLVGRRGERFGFLGGISLSAIGTAAVALGGGLWMPFVACLVAGAGQSARLLSRQSYARRIVGTPIRGRVMSLYGGIGRIALLTGPLLGGLLGESIGLRPTFLVAALILAAGLVPSLVAGAGLDGPTPASERQPRLGFAELMARHGRIIGLAGLVQLGASLVRVGRLVVVPLYGESIGLDLSDIGVVVAIAGGLDLLLFPLAGWLMDSFGRLYAIVPSLVGMAIGLLLLPLADTFLGLALAALVIGLGNGLGSGTMLTLSTDIAPADNTAEFLGVLRLLADVGRILGPLAVGIVADRYDLGASAVTLGLVGLATAALAVVAIGETGRAAATAGRGTRSAR